MTDDDLSALVEAGDAADETFSDAPVGSKKCIAPTLPLAKGSGKKKRVSKNPCQGIGLSQNANEKEFVAGFKQLQKDWAKLSPVQREERIKTLTNAQLKKSSVPEVGVAGSDLGDTSGQFDFEIWTLNINNNVLNNAALSDADVKDLADTSYHESRHAEQWYLMARKEASDGKKEQEIRDDLTIPDKVAKAASKQPFAKGDPQAVCANRLYNSVYGKNAAQRDKTLEDLDKKGADLKTAQDALDKANADPNATAGQKAAAQKKYDKAYAAYEKVYNAYRNLPEESDAWHCGDQIQALW